jgi:hypothetical protein
MRATISGMRRTLLFFIALALSVTTQAMAADDDAKLEKTARDLLSNFVAGHYDDAAKDFDTKMMAGLPPAKLAEVARKLDEQIGAFKTVKEAKFETVQGFRVVTLVSEYEKAVVNVQVAFDPDGKVAGLYFHPAG